MVLTSRRLPAAVTPGCEVVAVHALGRDEAVLLARQLPNLANLLSVQPGTRVDGPRVVRQVLEVAGGHPKLLELADAHATDPAILDQLLGDARQAWQTHGTDPTQHVTNPTPPASTEAVGVYLDVLDNWATQAVEHLDDPARLLLQLLCGVVETDRTSHVVDGNWADLWQRLQQPDPTPDPAPLLDRLVDAALTDRQPHDDTDVYLIHPAVADAIHTATPPDTQTAINTELAAYWNTLT